VLGGRGARRRLSHHVSSVFVKSQERETGALNIQLVHMQYSEYGFLEREDEREREREC